MTTFTRILLIDDEATQRAAAASALAGSDLSYTLVETSDAVSGLAAVKHETFDCVLIDAQLPGVVVADFLSELTSASGGRPAVIALSDDPGPENALTLLRAGAMDALSRSALDAHTLAQAIRRAQARHAHIVELRAAREDAEAESLALDRLNRQTTLILSIIAHDLRNPFQVLLGMSQLLAETALAGADPKALARRAAGIHEAATQAYGLLESLFAWASVHMEARAEGAPLDLDALFQGCARAMQERADEKGVTLHAPATPLRICAQEDAVAAVLRNLVANAIKFTAAGGGVTLSAERRGDRVAISVADTGIGMSPTQAANLFQVQSRSSSAGTAGERGAGLGLLLCRDLSEWIGGALECESELGKGTTFRLIAPAADDAG